MPLPFPTSTTIPTRSACFYDIGARALKARWVMPSHAEAEFTDPLVKYVMASTIDGAPAIFGAKARERLPGVRCVVPAAGELDLLPRG